MSYYDDASLVLIPSGVKASKVYSQKPTNGSGDFTFARASTATRTNSAGLVESGRTNFIRNSSMVGAATPNTIPTNWSAATPTGMTREVVGVGTESGFPYVDIRYFGTPTSTAFFGIQFETNTQIAALSGQAWAYSFYFKKIAGTVPSAVFQMTEYNSSGVFLTATSVVAPLNTTTTLTRFTGTRILTQATTAFTNIFIRIDVTAATAYDFTMRFYAPQIELGSVATDWIPTTTSAESVGIGINVPRLDYSGGATCPRLLLEPQRTNLALRSEEFDNASWTKRGSTITANTTTSPDGTVDADELTDDTSSFLHDVYFAPTGYVANSFFTLSAFVKPNTITACRLIMSQTATDYAFASFNLTTLASSTTIAGTFTNATSKIESLPNGWYRVSLTFQTGAGGTLSWLAGGCSIRLEKPYQTQIYTGTGQSLYVWGAQLEAGSFVSTYIPTTTAAVTRLADGAFKTGISSLIGQQEGVVYWEGILPQESTIGPSGEAGMFNTERQPNTRTALTLLHRANTGTLFARMFIGNGTFTPIITLSIGGFASGSFAKIAFAYKSGDSALYVNGIQRATSSVTYTSVTTMNDIYFNDNVVVYGYTSQQSVSQALLFKTRLTNSQLAELTTL